MYTQKINDHAPGKPTKKLEPTPPAEPDEITRALVEELRSYGRTWVTIADVLRERFHVNALAALRIAHDWTLNQAAERWNQRWPEQPKAGRNFAWWEAWPTRDGFAPSLPTLEKLAELYQCAASDLLVGAADYRALDSVRSVTT